MSLTHYRLVLAALALFTLVSFAPVFSLLASSAIANGLGCRLDEGSVHPCVLAGIDIGHTLYTAFALGWFVLMTWPAMVLSIAAWIFVGVRTLFRAS